MNGVVFAVADNLHPVSGLVTYDRRTLSFDFRLSDPDLVKRARDAVELAFGSLALQVDRDGHDLLGVWGYHPDAGWLNGSLGSPTATPARLRARLDTVPPRGVSLRLVPATDLTTIKDLRTGWIRVGRTGVPTGARIVEYATGCLAELTGTERDGTGPAGTNLVALWLRP